MGDVSMGGGWDKIVFPWLHMQWVELDGGAPSSFQVGVSPISFTIPLGTEDDVLGGYTVAASDLPNVSPLPFAFDQTYNVRAYYTNRPNAKIRF